MTIKRNTETGSHDMVSTVSIDKKKLLLWENWTKPSLSFITAADSEIKISTLSTAYGEKVLAFSEWLDSELQRHHESDIKAFEMLQREYAAAEQLEKLSRNGT
ncbi:MAG: hypothetical protein PHO76_08315 [Methylotenera sp.]|nr:hypothetical protein [Methylotenera sp.]MDD4926431.1 hypothetical protein [Methylotenera sp.]